MKLAVITGGSRGIGRATALEFLKAGYEVMNVARSKAHMTDVTDVALDLSATEWPRPPLERLETCAESADSVALVHNAARADLDSVRDLTADRLRGVLELNVVAPQRLNEHLLPHMKRGSSVLYVGSTLSEKAVANVASYATSKHALVGLMRATCQDLAGSGIHTVCVCPGFTDTEMLRGQARNDEGVIAGITSMITDGRLIEPAEIARVLVFCAENPVVNGAILHANLGQIER